MIIIEDNREIGRRIMRPIAAQYGLSLNVHTGEITGCRNEDDIRIAERIREACGDK